MLQPRASVHARPRKTSLWSRSSTKNRRSCSSNSPRCRRMGLHAVYNDGVVKLTVLKIAQDMYRDLDETRERVMTQAVTTMNKSTLRVALVEGSGKGRASLVLSRDPL